MAAFLPFFRTHSSLGTDRREPWVYGEPYTGIIRDFLRLRYRLLPYLYTLAWQATQTGHPIVRPLFWNRWEEMRLWKVEDAFLLGEALLVAPILEEGAQSRNLTLPAGTWFSFWDDQPFQGPGTVTLPACLEQIPLLVRAGSILPVADNDRLVLHIYAPEIEGDLSEEQILFSDAGDGYGAHRTDRFQLAFNNDQLELTWSSEGDFPLPYAEIELHLHNLQPARLWLDGEEFPYSDGFILQNPCARILFG